VSRTLRSQTAAGVLASASSSAALRQPVVQLIEQNGDPHSPGATTVSVTATVSGCGTETQSVNASSAGVATFTSLSFTQNTVGATCTITYTATGFQDFVETVKTKRIPTAVTVSSTTALDSTGTWINGTWYTESGSASNVTPTSLQNQLTSASTATLLATGDVTISSAISNSSSGAALSLTSTGGTVTTNSGASISVAGDLQVDAVTITAGANATSSGGKLTLKATGNITVSNSVSLITSGGAITLWSDSDANIAGNITTGSGVTISSSGGAITLAGGADNGGTTVSSGRVSGDGLPDGYAYGPTGGTLGVSLGALNILTSGTGNIFIAGHGHNLSNTAVSSGIYVNAGTAITATTGKIHIFGRSNGNSNIEAYSEGIRLRGVDSNGVDYVSITNSSTASDAIVIVGDASDTKGPRASGI
jgi:hypothetical protein